jgi:cytochrome c oxidase subunit IV
MSADVRERPPSAVAIWRRNLLVWAALLALLAATWLIAYVPLGTFNLVLSLMIAAMKVALVAALFMELAHRSALLRLAAVTGLFWLAILFLLTFNDVLSRPG